MDGQWLTYRELAVRLGVSVEAARRRALRGKWGRMPSNKGVTLVMPPDDLSDRCTPDVRLTSAPDSSALVAALGSHIKTLHGENEVLKQQLAAADVRDVQHAADLAGSSGSKDMIGQVRGPANSRSVSVQSPPLLRKRYLTRKVFGPENTEDQTHTGTSPEAVSVASVGLAVRYCSPSAVGVTPCSRSWRISILAH